MIKRALKILGWIVTAIGVAISLVAAFSLGYGILVPDTSGSPDARGMLIGASLGTLLIVGLPILVVGTVLLGFARVPGKVQHDDSI